MVLFSRKTKYPLAALSFKADDVGCLSMLTGRPAPSGASDPHFQGMLNIPNQTFTFILSNLSPKGMINFNVLHTPQRVSTVDPGPAFGVNQVNELHAGQSYTVEADQRNSCKMILAAKTKTVEEKEVDVTVKESEAAENPTGLYFYLSVVPDTACKELVDKFAEGTVWKVTPGFVRRVAKPPALSRQSVRYSARVSYQSQVMAGMRRAPHLDGLENTLGSPIAAPGDIYLSDLVTPASASFGSPVPAPFGAPVSAPPYNNYTPRQGGFGSTFESPIDTCGAPASASFGNATAAPFGAPALAPAACNDAFRPRRNADNEPRTEDNTVIRAKKRATGIPRTFLNRSVLQRGEKRAMESQTKYPPANDHHSSLEPVDIGATHAGELKYGRQVEVSSQVTGHDYAYEYSSEPTVLCLSIWEGMKFLGLSDVEKELEEEVQEWIKNEGKKLIESLNAVYKSEICVIDLESDADTVICTCGHQCVNHANVGNLRKCPMCRSSITAFVRADGVLLD
jgi:hypothetical protein